MDLLNTISVKHSKLGLGLHAKTGMKLISSQKIPEDVET